MPHGCRRLQLRNLASPDLRGRRWHSSSHGARGELGWLRDGDSTEGGKDFSSSSRLNRTLIWWSLFASRRGVLVLVPRRHHARCFGSGRRCEVEL